MADRYDEAHRRARSLGSDDIDNADLIAAPLDRLETLAHKGVA